MYPTIVAGIIHQFLAINCNYYKITAINQINKFFIKFYYFNPKNATKC